MSLKLFSFVWSLYIEDLFIEYFDSHQSAIEFAKKYYPQIQVHN